MSAHHTGNGNCFVEEAVSRSRPNDAEILFELCGEHRLERGECKNCEGCLACELEDFGREK